MRPVLQATAPQHLAKPTLSSVATSASTPLKRPSVDSSKLQARSLLCASHRTWRLAVARVSATLNFRLPQTLKRQLKLSTEASWRIELSDLIFQRPELLVVIEVAGVVVVVTEVAVVVASVADVALAIEVVSAVVVAVIEVASLVVATEVVVAVASAVDAERPMRIKLLTLEVLCLSRERERPSEKGLRPTIVWLDVLI